MMLPSRCNSAEILSQKYDASGVPGGSLVINKDNDDADNPYEATYDLSVKGDKRHHRAKALAEQNHHRKKRSNNRSTGQASASSSR